MPAAAIPSHTRPMVLHLLGGYSFEAPIYLLKMLFLGTGSSLPQPVHSSPGEGLG